MKAIVVLIVVVLATAASGYRIREPPIRTVRLYDHRNFNGKLSPHLEVLRNGYYGCCNVSIWREGDVLSVTNPIGCFDFATTYFNDRVSSINTRGYCYYLYEDGNCQGDYVRLALDTASGHADLHLVNFNDKASSLRAC